MTTGHNFWDQSIWSFVITLTILLLAMLVAAILRQRFAFIRRFMIPSSVLGGFLILLISFLFQPIAKRPLFDRSLLETMTYHGLGLGFAAMSLRHLDRRSETLKGDSFRTSLSGVSAGLCHSLRRSLNAADGGGASKTRPCMDHHGHYGADADSAECDCFPGAAQKIEI